MLTRRSILRAATGLLVPAVGLAMPRAGIIKPAHAASVAGNLAVSFDGATYLQNDGTIANLPTTASPYGMVSYWYNSTLNVNVGHDILTFSIKAAYPSLTVFQHLFQVKKGTPMAYLNLALESDPGGSDNAGPSWTSASAVLPYDGKWHNVMLSWNSAGPTLTAKVDQATTVMNLAVGTKAISGVPYYTTNNGTPLAAQVGSAYSQGVQTYYTGALAELFLFAGDQIDITDPNILAGFFQSNGLPVRNSSDGRSAIPGLTPQIYLSGDYSNFPLNMSAGTWTWPATYNDTNPPSSFYTATGTLRTASSDAWGGESSSS